MDPILLLKALILGVVEGLTEFLPISSTGHLIIVGSLLGYTDDQSKVFKIVIQLGAILAVCWDFRERIGKALGGLGSDPVQQRFAGLLIVGFLPAAILGLLFHSTIKTYLFNPLTVAGALSRSGATIMGGLIFGLSRKTATEFSFFLAIPTMFAATIYDVYKNWSLLHAADLPVFAVGFVASFVAAMLTVKALLRYVSNHDFTVFAWYRIAFGIIVLATAQAGWVEWAA